MDKPNCLTCIHKSRIPGDNHIKCKNPNAKVKGNPAGIKRGWFNWPWNFDPAWLVSCDSHSTNPEDAVQEDESELGKIMELLSLLR